MQSSYVQLPTRDTYPITDVFFIQVYRYYMNGGYANTLMSHVYAILQISYVMTLFIFLGSYVDYSVKDDLSQMIRYTGVSFGQGVAIFVMCVYIIGSLIRAYTEIRYVRSISQMYTHALEIDDSQLPVMRWDEVVHRLLKLSSYKNLSEVDITSCIMRRDNYLIALANMDTMAIHCHLLNHSLLATKSLEWIMNVVLFNFYCNDNGRIRPELIHAPDRDKTYRKLERWIRTLTVVSLVFAPFIWLYLSVYVVLRYAQDIKMQPSILASRKWTNSALWTFREYNELSHYFKSRISKSFVFANMYVNSFHTTSVVNLCRFLTFLFGSLTTVFVWFSLIDIEIVWDRSILWWIGVFGSLTALVRSGIPSSDVAVDSKQYMHHVAHFTHYMPKEWENYEVSEKVQRQMAAMFELKPLNVLRELVSILCIPYTLYYHVLPKSEEFVDFFIQYTTPYLIESDDDIHGGMCTFASFHVRQPKNAAPIDESKMHQSILTFRDNHRDWKPTEENQQVISRIVDNSSSDESMFHALRESSVDMLTESQLNASQKSKYPELQSSMVGERRFFFRR